jgi:hypothetical protein
MFSYSARLERLEASDLSSLPTDSDTIGQREAALGKLRQACRSELRGRTEPPLPTGCTVIDQALQGGLPRGQIIEAVGKVGRLSLALSVLAQATQRRELAVLIDGADALDPSGAAAHGVRLQQLLWVRVKNGNEALRAADLVLGAGGISLVVIYLVGSKDLQQLTRAALWSRLTLRAQRAKAAVLVCGERPLAQSFAVATLGFHDEGTRWQQAPGGRLQLRERRARIEVTRSRLGAPGDEQPWCLSK